MQDAHARTIGEQPKAGEPMTLERAVEMFTAKKSSKHKQTIRKYQYTLRNLKAWAVRNGRHYLMDITESDLEKYQASWTLRSNFAKRNEQERLRSFFRYCCASAEIKLAYNPTAQLEHFNVTSDEPEDPYTDKEYRAIVAAADRVPSFTGDVAERVKALISVMRYAGLSIQDAAILERDAVTPAQVNGRNCYRVQIRRSKTHTGVNNVVPKEVGDALLRVANGNPSRTSSTCNLR
jgi:site-specific recombinase XerD